METVYILEVEEYNTYSYSGTLTLLKGAFTCKEKAHAEGKKLVASGYPSYSVETYKLDQVY